MSKISLFLSSSTHRSPFKPILIAYGRMTTVALTATATALDNGEVLMVGGFGRAKKRRSRTARHGGDFSQRQVRHRAQAE
jgi:hypothetical protein